MIFNSYQSDTNCNYINILPSFDGQERSVSGYDHLCASSKRGAEYNIVIRIGCNARRLSWSNNVGKRRITIDDLVDGLA